MNIRAFLQFHNKNMKMRKTGMDIKEDLLVTIEFLLAANKARTNIAISTRAFNRVTGIYGLWDIAKSNLAPDKIYEALKPKAERFLTVEWNSLQSFGSTDYVAFGQARSSIADDILPSLDVVSYDWKTLFPPDGTLPQALNLAFKADELNGVMKTLSEGYKQVCEDIQMVLEPNLSFILHDMRVKVM